MTVTLCSARTVSSGAVRRLPVRPTHRPDTTPAGRPRTAQRIGGYRRRGRTHQWIDAVENGLHQRPQFGADLGMAWRGHAGHTSGLGRNRTVSSLPRSEASVTTHRRSTEANRTRRRNPATPMIKSSPDLPRLSALDQVVAAPAATDRPPPVRSRIPRSTTGRSGAGGAEPSRNRASSSSWPRALGPIGSAAR